jgi:ABC-2 type transport system permease protein
MIAVSGLFVPIQSLPPVLHAVARVLPLTYAVPLLQGIWSGDAWSTHLGDVAALVVVFVVCTALSAKIFRWELIASCSVQHRMSHFITSKLRQSDVKVRT